MKHTTRGKIEDVWKNERGEVFHLVVCNEFIPEATVVDVEWEDDVEFGNECAFPDGINGHMCEANEGGFCALKNYPLMCASKMVEVRYKEILNILGGK
jgi:hypothetical protein